MSVLHEVLGMRISATLASAALVTGLYAWSRARRLSLHGKVVLITGGARGLGLVLARELAKKGARLVICARDTVTLATAHAELEGAGAEVLAVPCDIRDRAQVNALVAAARATFGRIDVLVNNAGAIEVGPAETMTLSDFASSMQTHFQGPLNTMAAVIDDMRSRRTGSIVNIASIGGLVPLPHLTPYTASKHALVGLSSAMSTELAQAGITVTTVCPGLMRTGSPRNARFKGNHRAEYAWFSVGDALPLTAMRATTAARRIVRAIERGETFVIVGLQARLAYVFHALFPSLFGRVARLVNRALPPPGGIGASAARGYDSTSAVSPSLLTAAAERAAAANNELPYRAR